MTSAPKDLRTLLSNIKERPSMYVHNFSLSQIEYMIHGYAFALNHHSISELGLDFNRSFTDYLYETHGWSGSQGWAAAISRNFEIPEEAFYKFFELLKAYLKESS